MLLLVVLIVIIILVLISNKNNKKSKFVKILALPSGELIRIKRNRFYKLRNHSQLKWNIKHKYWTIKDRNKKVI